MEGDWIMAQFLVLLVAGMTFMVIILGFVAASDLMYCKPKSSMGWVWTGGAVVLLAVFLPIIVVMFLINTPRSLLQRR